MKRFKPCTGMPVPKKILLMFCCLGQVGLVLPAQAQRKLSGRVAAHSAGEALPRATVLNRNTHMAVYADTSGAFTISCSRGDTLLISMVGYIAQKIVVQRELFSLPEFTIRLQSAVLQLPEHRVRGRNYRTDSLRRREEYAKHFNYTPPRLKDVVSIQSPLAQKLFREKWEGSYDFFTMAVNLSALKQALSFREKQSRKTFRKRLWAYEEEDFINHYYDPGLVGALTGLTGDSLDAFMLRNRPTAAFLRNSSRYDLMVFIQSAYKRYRDSLQRQAAAAP